jgi:hypothetical protein
MCFVCYGLAVAVACVLRDRFCVGSLWVGGLTSYNLSTLQWWNMSSLTCSSLIVAVSRAMHDLRGSVTEGFGWGFLSCMEFVGLLRLEGTSSLISIWLCVVYESLDVCFRVSKFRSVAVGMVVEESINGR